jgi:hypothetical protein
MLFVQFASISHSFPVRGVVQYFIWYEFRLLTVHGHDLTFSVLHLGQALKYKLWWMIPTATFAGILEILGWSARLWSSRSPKLLTPYEMQ